ncbi:protein-L-isoaspartate(D-aspartate) O-methyltransferase [Corallococcus sp. AB011P]|uniref:protein-L-isoaspartate(D-aspartate) O-methyltransferase n=1 Tax=unclassified Corallococcus TaxID=2685029 RepID=UPI000EA215AD|nr:MULTISPECIES: protein-L-isoaspartate(D-aspartate) O-methyltransferase [unclassified Corallococcus]RKG48617.1 protein-L-isoaspartate(D-aspartate) O-methyltransferase [Corallococcus sp. AB011P]RKH90993.1 protein-L-isoaspartate(D-aspartate) O-methyltransferase [Corallococcus sp. AB045]
MGDWGRAEYLARQGIRDRRVLAAIANLSRADFVPLGARDSAHQDVPLPIGHGQTISQPYVVALMTEALRLRGCERVLEIGTGSGYQTAVLAMLAREVFTVEIVRELARPARRLLHRLGFTNVFYREGDGSQGWAKVAPFDAIIATAAPAEVPRELLRQLRPGGRMVIPVGSVNETQELLRIRRGQPGMLPRVEHLLPVRFVPMVGLGSSAPG